MTQAVARILAEMEQLSAEERADLADHLIGNDARSIPADAEREQLQEVRRRIAQVESGEVALIPGEEALAHVRRLVASNRKGN